jgi:adenylate cyclase
VSAPPTFSIQTGRVVARPESERAFAGTFDDITTWLVGPARRITNAVDLLDELAWRLVGVGIPLVRTTFNMQTLHPQFRAVGARWNRASGRCEEVLVGHGVLETSMYRDSPMARVFELGETVNRRLDQPDTKLDFPILKDLLAEGVTEYVAMPLDLSTGERAAFTVATDRPGGFHRQELVDFARLLPLIAPLLEIQIMRGITSNVIDAYLGPQTGRRVLAGDITRGRGETIRAVIWLCDLRGFSALAERLPADRVIGILNAYFECIVTAVHAQGGEVLKFLGDGLLAIFPVADAGLAPEATSHALDAATAALKAVAALAGDPVLGGEPVPRHCISLHVGDIIYGNIGAADRLDFTAIGPAVNLVARVDQLSKPLNRQLLMTGEFADVCTRKLQSLGSHVLRGMREPREIFTLPEGSPT